MTSVVHLLEKGLKPRKLHYYEMEVFKKKLRVKYRTAQTQIEWNAQLEDVFTTRNIVDRNVEEIDKYATKADADVPLADEEERYFRVFQDKAKDHCPIFDPTVTYNVGEVVQYIPTERSLKVKYSLGLGRNMGFIDFEQLQRCFWMCTRRVEGQTPADLGVEIDYDGDYGEYVAKYKLAIEQIKETSEKLGKTPSIDWSWTDWEWKAEIFSEEDKKLAVASGAARPTGHYPGNSHWVCLHFDGTGSYDMDTDQLIVNHKQIWLIRAKILSEVITNYKGLTKSVYTYDRQGPYGVANLLGQGLRSIFSQESGALDAIQKYTRDLEDISSYTIEKSMDQELLKDPRSNSDKTDEQKRWQFFYSEDFMRKVPTGKKNPKTDEEKFTWALHDMWGYDHYVDVAGRKIYTDNCFDILSAIMKNQSHHQSEIFLRREEPRDLNYPDRVLPSPNEHWEKRRNYWNGIFSQFHGQVEGWWDYKLKYHYGIEYLLKTLMEEAGKITPEQRHEWEIGKDEMDFRKHLRTAVLWNQGRRAGIGETRWHPSVHVVRHFVERGMQFIVQEQLDIQEQRVRANEMSESITEDEGYRKMVRCIIKYIKPNLWLLEETLQHFYSGRTAYTMHTDPKTGQRVRVGENDLKDWGKFNKQLLFKLLMLEGLCTQRGWLSDENKLHKAFHKVAKEWQTNGNGKGTWGGRRQGGTGVGFGASWITRESFRQIWPQGKDTLDMDKYQWLFDVIFTRESNPSVWKTLGMNKPIFDLKVQGPSQTGIAHRINPAEYRDFPWLHHEYLAPLVNSKDSNLWLNVQIKKHRGERTSYEYIMYIHKMYMRGYKLWHKGFKTKWPHRMGSGESNSTVYSKVKQLRDEHISFIKGYLPTHRIWHHPQYGCLAFGRLMETTKDTTSYKKFMFHVVAHCVEVKDSDVLNGHWLGVQAANAPSNTLPLSVFQWQVNGFSDDDMVESWLSENKGLFWRTMWKSPFVDIGAGMIADSTIEELRKGYEKVKELIKDELNRWDAKVKEGDDLTKNLLLERQRLEDLRGHKKQLERSIKSLEDRLAINKKEKEKAVNDTQKALTESE